MAPLGLDHGEVGFRAAVPSKEMRHDPGQIISRRKKIRIEDGNELCVALPPASLKSARLVAFAVGSVDGYAVETRPFADIRANRIDNPAYSRVSRIVEDLYFKAVAGPVDRGGRAYDPLGNRMLIEHRKLDADLGNLRGKSAGRGGKAPGEQVPEPLNEADQEEDQNCGIRKMQQCQPQAVGAVTVKRFGCGSLTGHHECGSHACQPGAREKKKCCLPGKH